LITQNAIAISGTLLVRKSEGLLSANLLPAAVAEELDKDKEELTETEREVMNP
jgi:hypothetical protein